MKKLALTLLFACSACADSAPASQIAPRYYDDAPFVDYDEVADDGATPITDDGPQVEPPAEGWSPNFDLPTDGVQPTLPDFVGTWVRDQAGGPCRNESWFQFAPDGRVVNVDARVGDCETPVFDRSTGRWSSEGAVIRSQWTREGTTHWTVDTIAVLDGDEQRALNRLAYEPDSEGRIWSRTTQSGLEAGGREQSTSTWVKVALDPPLPKIEDACVMNVELTVEIDDGFGPTERATETFDFECAVEELDGGRRVLAAPGYWGPGATGWADLFVRRGIRERHSAVLSNALYDAFRPVLFTESGTTDALFHDFPQAWYHGTVDTPPRSASEMSSD